MKAVTMFLEDDPLSWASPTNRLLAAMVHSLHEAGVPHNVIRDALEAGTNAEQGYP